MCRKHIRTYVATDVCGNSDTLIQIIHLQDETAPLFADFPVDAEYQCAGDVPTAAMPLGEDNCDDQPVIEYLGEETDGSCPMTITRTWTITDECNNSTEMSQTIVVNDTMAP